MQIDFGTVLFGEWGRPYALVRERSETALEFEELPGFLRENPE